jgi:hypothetical protein
MIDAIMGNFMCHDAGSRFAADLAAANITGICSRCKNPQKQKGSRCSFHHGFDLLSLNKGIEDIAVRRCKEIYKHDANMNQHSGKADQMTHRRIIIA